MINNERIEDYVKKIVNNHIKLEFSFWLIVLKTWDPIEFPQKRMNLGDTIFDAMDIIKNYEFHTHCNNNFLLSIISWFRRYQFSFLITYFFCHVCKKPSISNIEYILLSMCTFMFLWWWRREVLLWISNIVNSSNWWCMKGPSKS